MEFGKSKFTIGLFAGFIIGIFIADWLKLDLWWTGGIFAGLAIGLILFWQNPLWRWVFVCLIGLFFGLGYFYGYQFVQNSHSFAFGQKSEITGRIVIQPQIKPTKIQAIIDYKKANVLVDLPRYPEHKYGDILFFSGEITDPKTIKTSNNFNYGQYLLDHNIRGWVKNPEDITALTPPRLPWLVKIKKSIFGVSNKFQGSINRVLPEPYAALQNGLISGNRTTQIPDSLTSAFNRTGTTHIVAVSGYNITIIISALTLCLALFSRRLAFWMTILFILVFVVMTGASASVVRAGLLGGLAAWGKLEGRRANHLILILLVGAIMLLANPFQLKGDVGFQLSFSAFIGLVYLSPLLANLKWVAKWPEIIKTILAETLAAQLVCLPILISNFGILSIVAPIVNLLVLPIIPSSMLLGFITGLAGFVWFGLAKIFAIGAWLALKYIVAIVQGFSGLRWAAIMVPVGGWWWIPIYYLVAIIIIWRGRVAKQTA